MNKWITLDEQRQNSRLTSDSVIKLYYIKIYLVFMCMCVILSVSYSIFWNNIFSWIFSRPPLMCSPPSSVFASHRLRIAAVVYSKASPSFVTQCWSRRVFKTTERESETSNWHHKKGDDLKLWRGRENTKGTINNDHFLGGRRSPLCQGDIINP